MNFKSIKCYIIAIIEFFQHGSFIPHVYKDVESKKAIIIATENNFRVSENYEHVTNETVYPGALLVTSRCVCCGKEIKSWYREPCRYSE